MSKGQRVKFFGSKFAVITAWGSANPVSGSITNASPPVVTDVAHGLLDGDVIRVSGAIGMTELNGEVAAVDSLGADTFSLLNYNSLNYGVYTSGASTAKATFSESCEVTGYAGPSGTTAEATVETNCGIVTEFGAPDPGSVTINFNRAPVAFQQALEAARKSGETTAIKTTLPNGKGIMIDIGVVTQTDFSGSAGGLYTGSATLRRTQERIDLAV